VIKLSDVKVRVQYRLRVRQRLMVLHFARLQGPTAAGRRFGVSVRTIRRWRVRWRQDAVQGLVPRYPRRRGRRITPRVIDLIGQARRDLAYGAQRTQLWLRRVHDVRVAMGTIQRIFRDLGLPRLRRTPKRVPRQMKLFEKAEPGESVQVDVKFVKIAGRGPFSTPRSMTARGFASCGSIGGITRARAWRSWASCAGRCPSGSASSSATTGMSSPSPLPWPCRRWGSGTATSSLGARNKTARWSEVIGSTRKNSGGVTDSPTLTRPRSAFGSGKPATTTSASPWRFRGERQLKNWPPCCRLPRRDARVRSHHNVPQARGQS
jgi:transposase